MNDVPNVLYDKLPDEWNGYPINSGFQIGVQIFLASEDKDLLDVEKSEIVMELLFPEDIPPQEQMQECISWFLNGWSHDRSSKEKEKRRLLDFNVDQWRIYADFRQIYRINLNEADLHWWEFMGMLWNMPYKYSSFMQVIDIRKKEIKAKMSAEEKKAIRDAQKIYGLDDAERVKREYSNEEKKKIDDVDALRQKMKQRRK